MGLFDFLGGLLGNPPSSGASPGAAPQQSGMIGLLSPDDRFMAAMQALSHMGAQMAQPGQSKGQALASGFGGLGAGLQSGMQNALMQNIMAGNFQQQLQQRKAQEAAIAGLPPEQQAYARANPAEFFKTKIDRMMPKQGEIPPGMNVGPDGTIRLAPGMADYLAQRTGAETGARVAAERTVQNNIPLTAESPEFKGRVAGAEAAARNKSELDYADPLARARLQAEYEFKPKIAGATAAAENPALVSRAVQIAQGTGQAQNNVLNNAGKLRDDFSALSPVKAYREAMPIYQSMVETAPRNSKASDLNLVYGLAKIFDPNSVVREGEMVMVKNTSALPDWLVGTINGLNGGAQLQPDTRSAIMSEAKSRVDNYKATHDAYAEHFGQIADRYGIPRNDVIVATPAPPPASSAPPQRMRTYNPATGKLE